MKEKEELLEVSEEYKKGFNKADRVLTEMPDIFNGIKVPDINETDFDRGFNARLAKHEMDQRRQKEHAPKKPDFLKDFDARSKGKNKDINRSK